jgi:hypothetical protein
MTMAAPTTLYIRTFRQYFTVYSPSGSRSGLTISGIAEAKETNKDKAGRAY